MDRSTDLFYIYIYKNCRYKKINYPQIHQIFFVSLFIFSRDQTTRLLIKLLMDEVKLEKKKKNGMLLCFKTPFLFFFSKFKREHHFNRVIFIIIFTIYPNRVF